MNPSYTHLLTAFPSEMMCFSPFDFPYAGSTIVCGDSHTSTHGAFGALAFGIGTSEVEHVLATQTLVQPKSKNMRISVEGIFYFKIIMQFSY